MAEISDTTILGWVDEMSALEQQIKDLQDAKRDFIASIRETHGKPKADGLKTALRLKRMDGEKRLEAEEADEFACHVIALIEKGPSRTRAPRATHTREAEPQQPAAETPAPAAVQSAAPVSDPVPDPKHYSATLDHFTPPAFLTTDRGPLRPHCLKPEACAGVGRTHCHTCTKAAEKEGIAA